MEINKKPVRLLRIILAALFAELIPLVIMVATVTVYSYLGAIDQDKAIYQNFTEKAGYFIGPVAGTLATLGMGFWAARKPVQARLMHGWLTGALVVLLDLIIFATPKADFDLKDVLVLLAKFLAGYLGGYLAQRRYGNTPTQASKSHPLI